MNTVNNFFPTMNKYNLNFSSVTDFHAFLVYSKNYVAWKSIMVTTEDDDAFALSGKELNDIKLVAGFIKEKLNINLSLMVCLDVIYKLAGINEKITQDEVMNVIMDFF